MTATRRAFADGRWHFQHGPIDCVIEAHGDADAVRAAHEAAWCRFASVLDELVAELPLLKRPVDAAASPGGLVARRMWKACLRHGSRFVTPMAAVAGAVADELIQSYRRPGIARAWVNNGGDIALHLASGTSARVGLFADLARVGASHHTHPIDTDADFVVAHAMPVRGVATSGWRGRSFSLGIADSVTVLARDAATADAAATMIANAVDVDDRGIVRRPACLLKDDSDLGDRLVTVDVPPLGVAAVRRALSAGVEYAQALRSDGVVFACVLVCQGMMRATDGLSPVVAPASRALAHPASRRLAHPDGREDAWHAPRFVPHAMNASA